MRVLIFSMILLSGIVSSGSWLGAGRLELGGGRVSILEVMSGSVREILGEELGGSQFSDVIVGRFRLGEEWIAVVPEEVCRERGGRISVIDTEVLQLYPGLSVYDIQTILQNAAAGGSGNVRLIDLGRVHDAIVLSALYLCEKSG